MMRMEPGENGSVCPGTNIRSTQLSVRTFPTHERTMRSAANTKGLLRTSSPEGYHMSRWHIIRDGHALAWDVTPGDLHTDDIEMAGFGCAQVVRYGMTEEGFVLEHHPVFPTLRTRPNNTHASYHMAIPSDRLPQLLADGTPLSEMLFHAELDGTLYLETTAANGKLKLLHRCYPSEDKRLCFECITVENRSDTSIVLTATSPDSVIGRDMGPMGINLIEYTTDFAPITLASGESYTYSIAVSGRVAHEPIPHENADDALRARRNAIRRLTEPMQLDTGDELLDTMFRFAKIRAGESIFDTRFGYGRLHSPGGFRYYAATWCNDQVEYAGPYFAYTGDPVLIDAAMNAYRMYIPFMCDAYLPIPSSVIAEGVDFWNGADDRGDAAMYLYGASRYALTTGNRTIAEELLPAIEWCAEYCERQKNAAGVIASDFDELEGRFPAGDANLCTSTLTYAGLLGLAALERTFGYEEKAVLFEGRAAKLASAIETHFGQQLHGMETYCYYEGCEKLRSWICMPLCVGLYDRTRGTVNALCSDYLMKPEGFLTEEGSVTIWDRSTLYALRGIFAAGETETAFDLLRRYSANRLLGERVPYAVEAYPEGGRRQLSGESALYCKVITEGILCMIPTGLHSFTLKPTLPVGLDHLYLRNIVAHGATFDVLLERDGWQVIRTDGTVLGYGADGTQAEINV